MLRFFRKKYILIALAIVVLLIVISAAALFFYVQSPAFEATARDYITREVSKRTGAVIELQGFRWSLPAQRFQLEGLTIHGKEAAGETPLAVLPRIEIGVNLRSLFQKKVSLFELTLTNPAFHILIDPNAKTNFPTPPARDTKPLDLEIAIENFHIVHGSTVINERQIDTDFLVTNMESEMSFHSTTGILNSQLRFDGQYKRYDQPIIPYTFDAEMDYTNGTLLPHRITLHSGASTVQLEGRIDDLLNTKVTGRLAYKGDVQVPFLNYFFADEKFAGKAVAAGYMEFSDGYFFTAGNTASESIDYDGWQVRDLNTEYSYRFPDKRAVFKNFRTNVVGGKANGVITIENVPGPAHILLDLDYAGINGVALARLYPWDPKYRIYSNLTGTLHGWFEGKFERYAIAGNADMKPIPTPNPVTGGVVPFPLAGHTKFTVVPDQARVSDADIQLNATHIKADGLIDRRNSDLKFFMESTDLRDGYFIYADANGEGTFDGALTGPVQNPVFDGSFTLHHHVYQHKWTIDGATGSIHLPTETQIAVLKKTHVTQGRSEIVVDGSTSLTGSTADLNVRAIAVHGEDLQQFVTRKIGGIIDGTVRLTAFAPVKLEGDLRADTLQLDDRSVGSTRAHVRYFEPAIDLTALSIIRNGSSLTGNVSFNTTTEDLKFSARVSTVDFDSLRWLGLPDELNGVIVQANLQGEGPLKQPNVRGTGTIRDLTYKTEKFPQAQLDINSTGSKINATLQTGKSLTLEAQVDAGSTSYPFNAKATLTNYPLENLAGLSRATLNATGTATMSGLLTNGKTLQGQGRIESATAQVEQKVFRTTSPFTFNFNADHLELSNVIVAGDGTQGTIVGTIGFTNQAALNLSVRGQFDLALLSAQSGDWTPAGTINVDGRIRGTADNPDLSGVAHLTNASVSKRGLFTSLTDVNGDLGFDGNRVTLNDVKGQVGGGSLTVQGSATLRQATVQTMNIRIDTNSVRIRYPEGLRTVVDGALTLRGGMDSPVIEGNLKIQSMNYRGDFEDLVAMFGSIGTGTAEPSALDRLRLGLHVEGGRNITIQNEFANLEARVDLNIHGTVEKPALTGHVEASGGTLSFQGKRYTVTRGNVDFVDPLRIEPVVDIQAETDIRDYRVILAISGKADHMHIDTRSDPPLSQIEVLNLIAGGKTREELAEKGTNVTQEQLFKGSAASILSDIVQQRIGGSAFQRLGIGRVRIGPDPSLVSAQNQTTLRITIEEQFSKDLTVTYSRELSTDKQEIIQIEYFVNKNISIIASKDEFDDKGLDIKFRKRFK